MCIGYFEDRKVFILFKSEWKLLDKHPLDPTRLTVRLVIIPVIKTVCSYAKAITQLERKSSPRYSCFNYLFTLPDTR